ncbi:MAG TPA: hypothetical protein VMU46_00070 [Burkholderiales bacterium]|nr:hypothetical protein [Burkholderiales bacterium]
MKGRKWLVAAVLAIFSAASVFAAPPRGRIDSMASVDKIKPGVTTVQQVREMFGAPARGPMKFPKKGIEAIEYGLDDLGTFYVISISYGSDGIVRDVMKKRPSGP